MIHGTQTVSPVDVNIDDGHDDGMGEDEDDRKSLEEPLFEDDDVVSAPDIDGWNPTASDAEAWLEEQEAEEWLDAMDRNPNYGKEGEEVIYPVPGPRKAARPRRWQAREITRPVRMTDAELDWHRLQGHVVYHPGCEQCVKARALADRHHRADEVEEEGRLDQPPTIGADFCFPGDAGSNDPLTVLVVNDSRTKSLFASSSPGKEVVTGEHSEYLVTKVADNINSLGHGKVVFKTDKEKPLLALQSCRRR